MGIAVGFGFVGFAVTGAWVGRPFVGDREGLDVVDEAIGLVGASLLGAAFVGEETGRLVGFVFCLLVGKAVGSTGADWDGDATS